MKLFLLSRAVIPPVTLGWNHLKVLLTQALTLEILVKY